MWGGQNWAPKVDCIGVSLFVGEGEWEMNWKSEWENTDGFTVGYCTTSNVSLLLTFHVLDYVERAIHGLAFDPQRTLRKESSFSLLMVITCLTVILLLVQWKNGSLIHRKENNLRASPHSLSCSNSVLSHNSSPDFMIAMIYKCGFET